MAKGAAIGVLALSVIGAAVGAAPGAAASPTHAWARQPAASYTQFPLWRSGNYSTLCDPYDATQRGTANAPIVAANLTAGAEGCWAAGADGGVFSFGDAKFYGSMGGKRLDAPVVGMAAMPTDGGYWLVAADGGVFSFGDAKFYGSMGGKRLDSPVVGMAADPATGGYWEVASDGGVFSFHSPFYGSMGGKRLDAPVVGMAAMPTGGGYWLVAADGGVFSFGRAPFHGSMGGVHLDAPVVGMALDQATGGYWLTSSDGGVFSFDAPFYGSTGGRGTLPIPVAGILATSAGTRYFQLLSDPAVEPGVTGRSGYDLARRTWVDDSRLDCASQSLPLFQGAQYLLIGERVDGGTTSGYEAASNELYQESTLPGMGRTSTQQAEWQRDTAALNDFFHSDVPGTCG